MSMFDLIRFPYQNMQQLNLDWIMEKIKGLEEQINTLSGMVDPEYIDGEIGQLQEQVDVLNYFQRLYTSDACGVGTNEWSVYINNDGYITAAINCGAIEVTSLTPTTGGNVYVSQDIKVPLPMPVRGVTVSGNIDRRGLYISNVDPVPGYVGIKFKIASPDNYATPFNPVVRLFLTSQIRVAPATIAASPNTTYGSEVIAVADTYLNAVENGRKLSYGDNFFFRSSNVVNDSSGRGKMECDTFVDLCLRGIPYEKSPYVDETPGLTYDYDDLYADVSSATVWAASTAYAVGDYVSYSGVADFWRCTEAHTSSADFDDDITKWEPIWIVNPNGYTWVSGIGLHPADDCLKRDIRIAADFDFLGFRKSKIFSDITRIASGDVAIWVRRIHAKTDYGYSENSFFDNVGHVAIVSVENGIPFLYEVTSAALSNGKVVNKRRMDSGVLPTYFARFA